MSSRPKACYDTHASEWRLTFHTCKRDRPVAEQGVHAVGTRKTKRGIKISRCGIKSDPPPCMKISKIAGGADFDAWNNNIARQGTNSVWYGLDSDADQIHEKQCAALSLLAGVSAKDGLEGMLAAQLLASHNAAMECYRRASGPNVRRPQRESKSSEQAIAHACDVVGSIEPASRQRPTKSHRRTCPPA